MRRPLSRPAEPVRATPARGSAVSPARPGEPKRYCSPRPRAVVAVRPRASARRVSMPRVSVQRASVWRRSARAPARAAAGPGSREAGAARQRQAPPVAQVTTARPVLQPLLAQVLSRAQSLESWRFVAAAPATACALRRHNPRLKDRTKRPQCALLDSNLTHRSQALLVVDVPHLERSRGSESLRRAHRCSPARALKPGSVRIRSQIGSTRRSIGVIRLPFMRNCREISGTACAASPFIAWISAR